MSRYYVLFQQRFRREPFWILVGCILANRSVWSRCSNMHAAIRRLWPSPVELARAPTKRIESLLRAGGLHRTKARNLKRMAQDWVMREPKTAHDVLRMSGCGTYASDSWAIFVDREIRHFPDDKELLAFLRRTKRRIYRPPSRGVRSRWNGSAP